MWGGFTCRLWKTMTGIRARKKKVKNDPETAKKQEIKRLWDFEEAEKYVSTVSTHMSFLSIVSLSGSSSPQVQNLATVNKEEINHCSPIS